MPIGRQYNYASIALAYARARAPPWPVTLRLKSRAGLPLAPTDTRGLYRAGRDAGAAPLPVIEILKSFYSE